MSDAAREVISSVFFEALVLGTEGALALADEGLERLRSALLEQAELGSAIPAATAVAELAMFMKDKGCCDLSLRLLSALGVLKPALARARLQNSRALDTLEPVSQHAGAPLGAAVQEEWPFGQVDSLWK